MYRYAVLKSSVKAMMKNKGAEGAAKGGSIVLCSSAVSRSPPADVRGGEKDIARV